MTTIDAAARATMPVAPHPDPHVSGAAPADFLVRLTQLASGLCPLISEFRPQSSEPSQIVGSVVGATYARPLHAFGRLTVLSVSRNAAAGSLSRDSQKLAPCSA